MKDEIINRILAVCSALDNVTVSGRQNLANLSGSIAVLDEVAGMLSKIKFPEASAQKDEEKKE